MYPPLEFHNIFFYALVCNMNFGTPSWLATEALNFIKLFRKFIQKCIMNYIKINKYLKIKENKYNFYIKKIKSINILLLLIFRNTNWSGFFLLIFFFYALDYEYIHMVKIFFDKDLI